jgi:hypothetical protein
MIARFRIFLARPLLVPAGVEFTPIEIEHRGYAIRVGKPDRAALDRTQLHQESTVPFAHLSLALVPATPQPVSPTTNLDGRPAVLADVLPIDVIADEFDRTKGTNDPPVEVVFEVANSVLARLRTLGRSFEIVPVTPASTLWLKTFLHDDGSEFEPEPDKYKAAGSGTIEAKLHAIPENLWQAVNTLPFDHHARPWDDLLLDAIEILPRIGPSIVLRSAAIETRIDSALDILADAAGWDDEFWKWLRKRNADFWKEPSVNYQLSVVLHGLIGRSLKDEPLLWQGHRNIRKARNTFAHEGVATIGGKPVDLTKARQLRVVAEGIIDWIETLLPEVERRLPLQQWTTIEFTSTGWPVLPDRAVIARARLLGRLRLRHLAAVPPGEGGAS